MPGKPGRPKKDSPANTGANNGAQTPIVPTQTAVDSPSPSAGASDSKTAPLHASRDHVTGQQSPAAPGSTPIHSNTELNVIVRQVLESLLEDENFVNQITRTIRGKILNELKESICQEVTDSLEYDSAKQKDKIEVMKREIDELKAMNDDAEQYSRRTCLVFSGLSEVANENTDNRIIKLCKEDLGLDVQMSDIERSHRLGPQTFDGEDQSKKTSHKTSPTVPRNIIVKFTNYRQEGGNYWVLDTDYETYTLVHGCSEYFFGWINVQSNWILGRDRVMSEEVIRIARQTFAEQGINVRRFMRSDQRDCGDEPPRPSEMPGTDRPRPSEMPGTDRPRPSEEPETERPRPSEMPVTDRPRPSEEPETERPRPSEYPS